MNRLTNLSPSGGPKAKRRAGQLKFYFAKMYSVNVALELQSLKNKSKSPFFLVNKHYIINSLCPFDLYKNKLHIGNNV